MIKVKVSSIENVESLHIVKFDFHGIILTMMSLELHKDIEVGSSVKVAIKPTHVAIAKELSGELSYSNQLNASISSINSGKLLSSVKCKFFDASIESIITQSSAKRMALQVEDEVVVLIKASELFISEICDV